jgi:pimeloyl-ACP methyl ester carboxylesterase
MSIRYKLITVDQNIPINIFYREAGDRNRPCILLLHGFPTSSVMFEQLMPLLARNYYVIAPDYPGFGNSSSPSVIEFNYTFDNLSLNF